MTQVHAPPAAEHPPSDAPETGWSDPPPANPAPAAAPTSPAPIPQAAPTSPAPIPQAAPTSPAPIPVAAASSPAVAAPAAASRTAEDGAALRKIAREAVEEALGSLRTSQRELDARLKNLELRLEQLAHRPPPLPATASPAPAPVVPVAAAAPVAPAPAFAPMVPAFAPAAAPAPAVAAAPAPAPTAAPVSMIPVSIAPSATPSMAPLGMDPGTTELMRLAKAGVSDDMMGGEFDGARRSRRLKMVFGFFIFLVIAGAIASILVSQSMNSHG